MYNSNHKKIEITENSQLSPELGGTGTTDNLLIGRKFINPYI